MQNKSRAGIRLDLMPEIEDAAFHDHLEFAELQDSLMHSIESLPGQCRKIFVLSRFEQLKYAEIAAQLGLSVKTIENQISKALKLIQEKLDCILILSLPFIC
jgi:RNA polymerase sigma-70 factor (ECF subfamily)